MYMTLNFEIYNPEQAQKLTEFYAQLIRETGDDFVQNAGRGNRSSAAVADDIDAVPQPAPPQTHAAPPPPITNQFPQPGPVGHTAPPPLAAPAPGQVAPVAAAADDDPRYKDVEGVDWSSVDEAGVPWHPEFHARTKATNANGRWRRKRGIKEDVTARADAYEEQFIPEGATPEPASPVRQADPFAAAGQPQESVISYDDFVSYARSLQTRGIMTTEVVNESLRLSGITDSNQYFDNPQARKIAFEYLQGVERESGR